MNLSDTFEKEADGWLQTAASYEARLTKVEAERDALVKARNDVLIMLADLFSESAHETWSKEEIVNIIEDAIRLGAPAQEKADG